MYKSLLIPSVFTLLLAALPAKSQTQYSEAQTRLKVQQLIEKKAEYHRLTNGQREGYRIKIYFGVDRDKAKEVRTEFSKEYPEVATYEEYQQPNWVVTIGDYSTKLEAFEWLKRIQATYQNAFIVKSKINPY